MAQAISKIKSVMISIDRFIIDNSFMGKSFVPSQSGWYSETRLSDFVHKG